MKIDNRVVKFDNEQQEDVQDSQVSIFIILLMLLHNSEDVIGFKVVLPVELSHQLVEQFGYLFPEFVDERICNFESQTFVV